MDAPDATLNPEQRAAVDHGDTPLLVIAGAGSGKTQTLAHRVAALIRRGVDPRRILLLTFTRRAATEMIRRAARAWWVARATSTARCHGRGPFTPSRTACCASTRRCSGLDPGFTLLDREDSADLLDRLRLDQLRAGRRRAKVEGQEAQEGGGARLERRFPRKGTCLAIYSNVVNTRAPLRACLERTFPWCLEWEDALRALFAAYTDAKLERQVLDYDDLLLYWFHLVGEPGAAARVGALFDHILVDEYQDTNTIQAEILRRIRPDGRGRDGGRRRRAGDLLVPRGDGAQHPRLPRAVPAAARRGDARRATTVRPSPSSTRPTR